MAFEIHNICVIPEYVLLIEIFCVILFLTKVICQGIVNFSTSIRFISHVCKHTIEEKLYICKLLALHDFNINVKFYGFKIH